MAAARFEQLDGGGARQRADTAVRCHRVNARCSPSAENEPAQSTWFSVAEVGPARFAPSMSMGIRRPRPPCRRRGSDVAPADVGTAHVEPARQPVERCPRSVAVHGQVSAIRSTACLPLEHGRRLLGVLRSAPVCDLVVAKAPIMVQCIAASLPLLRDRMRNWLRTITSVSLAAKLNCVKSSTSIASPIDLK